MRNLKGYKAFEQQIHRIHELLEGSGAKVTWDDHIPDPDNPSQPRQIDIAIRRDGKLTLVECRQHKSPQGVKWIEELMGRRTSLAADATIAVSSSGFTAGALKKAKRYGITPRYLCQLTDLEVKSWGQRVAVSLYFYQYSDLELSLCFKRESTAKLDLDVLRSEFTSHPGVQSFFNAAALQLGTINLISGEHAGQTVAFGIRLQLAGFQLSGESVVEVDFRGKACLISKEVSLNAVLSYGEPDDCARRDVTVETFSLGGTSIVHHGNRISVFLDVSQVQMPPFCQFRFFRLTGQDEMDHEAIELAGCDKLWVVGDRININICSV
jgi:hypothetical protein